MLELSGIRVAHGRRTVLSVDRLSLGGPGLTAVLEHNGSGKSTLMRLLARGVSRHGNRDARGHAAATQRGLAETGLSDLAEQDIDPLSGGQRQRAWIAMLLAQEAPLLLLDAPISPLDPARQLEVLALLRRLARSGARRVVAILQDVNLAARDADRIVALKQGGLVFDGPPEALVDPDVLSRLHDVRAERVAHPRGGLPLAIFTDAA